MRTVCLEEVVEVNREIASENECRMMPYVGLDDIEKECGRFSDAFRPKSEHVLATKFRFTEEHVLYGKLRPYLNKVALPHFRGVCTTEILPLLPKPGKLERGFLYALLLSPRFVNWASQNVTGANLPRLGPDRLLEYEFPLPDLSEQKRVASILERADRLRRLRRYQVQLASTILQARFLELFGDPVLNPQGWERARIEDLGDVQTGNTPPREDSENYGPGVEWIKSDNISLNELHPSRAVEELSARGAALGRVVGPGSLLVTCIAGSPTSIGNVVLTDRRVAFNQQINAVTPRSGVVPLFLYGLLLAAKSLVQKSTTLAMKRMITKGNLEQLLLICPPSDLQVQFTQFVERWHRLGKIQREGLRQAEHLFQTLLQRAFTSGL